MNLWEFDEFGEPWLENTPLLVINRKRSKKGKKSMARRRKRVRRVRRHRLNAPRRVHRRGRRHTARRRRRNAWTMPGVVASINPRRRRRRGRKNSPRRHRRGRRNAAIFGMQLPSLESVGFGALGYVGTPLVEGVLTGFLPSSLFSNTIGKYAVRIGSVLGLRWAAKMVGLGGRANMIAIGGGMYVLTSAIREFASGMLPAQAAAALPAMGYYASPTLRAYTTPTSATYHPAHQLGAPAFGAINTAASAPFGGARIVAQRFRRFQ